MGLNLVYFTFPDTISAEIYAGCLRAPFCRGGAVTAHDGLKSKIIPLLDVVEPLAQRCRAVNTVVNVDGKLHGYNTDVHGLRGALRKGLEEFGSAGGGKIKTAAIYGNGGVSGVAWFVLKEVLGPDGRVTIVGRNPQRVLAKRRELGIESEDHFDGPYDLVVDATPVASQPDLPEQFKAICAEAKVVFCHSMPEKDGKPNYLEQFCQEHNVSYIPGSWMHAAQMVKQYGLYFSQEKETVISEEDICKTWNLELP